MSRFLGKAWTIARKDLLSELRGREFFLAMVLFGFLVVLITSFAIEPGVRDTERVRSGVLWAALTFSSVLGLIRSFQAERENEAIRGLFAAPVPRAVIYLGKFLAGLVFLFVSSVAVLVFFAFIYNLESWSALLPLLLVLLLAAIGFSAVGTLFSALTLGLRTRDALFSILLFPLLIPLILAATRSTQAILSAAPLVDAALWLVLMAVYDVVFLVMSLLVFDYVLEE